MRRSKQDVRFQVRMNECDMKYLMRLLADFHLHKELFTSYAQPYAWHYKQHHTA